MPNIQQRETRTVRIFSRSTAAFLKSPPAGTGCDASNARNAVADASTTTSTSSAVHVGFPLVEILLKPGDGKRYPKLYTPSRIFRPALTTCFAKAISCRSVELDDTSLAHIGGDAEAAQLPSFADEVDSGLCAVAAEIANDLEIYRFMISTSLPALDSKGSAPSDLLLGVELADGGDITAWRSLMKVAASWIAIGFARVVTRAVVAFRVASVLVDGLFATVFGSKFVREATGMGSVDFLAAAFNAVLEVVALCTVAPTDVLPGPGFVVCRSLVALTGLTDEVVVVSASFTVVEAALALAVVVLVGRATAVRVAAAVRLPGAASALVLAFVALMLQDMSLNASRVSC